MADRVHPASISDDVNPNNVKPSPDDPEKLDAEAKPKPGMYVIQIPKDQIYRVPPPENAHLFESYSRRGARGRRRSSCCCRCFLWTLLFLLFLLVALLASAAILYFVFRPKLPSYSLDQISIRGFDVNRNPLSPEFDLTVRADNPNKKIGIYYREGSDISVSYAGVALCHGSWPVFYQGSRNVTVFRSVLRGSGIRMASSLWGQLADQQRRGAVALEVDVAVPVRVKFGAVTSWTFTVSVGCHVVVDALTQRSKIVSKSCKTKVKL